MKRINTNITTGKQGASTAKGTKHCYFCVKHNLPGADTNFNKDCTNKEEYVKEKFGDEARLKSKDGQYYPSMAFLFPS